MNYYPFHIGDYASATRHLSWDEDAAYRRLLDVYYTTEKPLPGDLRAVYRLVMASTDAQRQAVEVVLGEFFQLTDDGWRNARADTEIAVMQDKQQKQRDKANKRWAKPRTEPGNASAMPRHEEKDAAASGWDADAMPPTPTPTPTPKNIPTTSDAPASPPDERDLIWSTGVRLITASGKTEAQARSFLGGQVKSRGSPAVARAVTQALIDRPVEPIAYIAEVSSGKRQSSRGEDRSAAGRVRAAVERERAEEARQRGRASGVVVDGEFVRAQVG